MRRLSRAATNYERRREVIRNRALITEIYRAGYGVRDIAKAFGYGQATVHKYLSDWGVIRPITPERPALNVRRDAEGNVDWVNRSVCLLYREEQGK